MTDPPTARYLAESTTVEIAADVPAVLLVPVGSCEQHGPHLPLDTDTRIAAALCNAAAAGRRDVAVAPPIAIGASGEHAGFAGTMSIGTEVLGLVVVELVRSVVGPHRAVVLVNGHGGNSAALASAAAQCWSEGRPTHVYAPRATGGDAHAGLTETSVMLALHPASVRQELAEPGCVTPLADIADQLRSEGVLGVAPNGVLGDPTGATPQHGRRLLARWVAELAEVIDGCLAG